MSYLQQPDESESANICLGVAMLDFFRYTHMMSQSKKAFHAPRIAQLLFVSGIAILLIATLSVVVGHNNAGIALIAIAVGLALITIGMTTALVKGVRQDAQHKTKPDQPILAVAVESILSLLTIGW